MSEFDLCVIGSGAGGSPVAFAAAEAGWRVVVLEKGPWYLREEFTKDELGQTRRAMFVPDRRVDPHVWEKEEESGKVVAWTTRKGWNGVCVGGATNLMSGFFYRLLPEDFRLKSAFGAVEGSTVEDWPIAYEDLAPWYDLVEHLVGVSGAHREHPHAEPRSQPFPLPPTEEHPFARVLDEVCGEMGLHADVLPRAVLSRPREGRGSCFYTRYCGSYGCSTGAKGSSIESFLPAARATGRCTVIARAHVQQILTDESGQAVAARYRDADGTVRTVRARVFAVACGALETARLLLVSASPRHPLGLANHNGLVGQNLQFSTFAASWCDFPYERFEARWPWLRSASPFVNRSVRDWYTIDDPVLGRRRGGTLNFLLMHGNPIAAAEMESFNAERPVWGWALKERLRRYFVEAAHLRFEVFGDYTPVPGGRVILDPDVRDQWGVPAARAQIRRHPRDLETVRWLNARGQEILARMGGEDIRAPQSVGEESSNLIGGTCRFGRDPATSILDPDCRAHSCENLFVTDGSFMPTGGSVPNTFTIYANALRVGQAVVAQLGGRRGA
jgi:choline dehydrogenase-like flavoprotein